MAVVNAFVESFTVLSAISANIFLVSQSDIKWSNTASVAITSSSQYSATLVHNSLGTGWSHGNPNS